MSIKLFGKSQVLKKDERLKIIRQGTDIPFNVVYVDGKPVKRRGIHFEVKANVQPLGSRDLLLVPELDRFKEQWWIFVENHVVITEEGIEIQAEDMIRDNDQVFRLGKYYQVQGVENWGSFVKARIMRIDVGPNAED